MNPDGSEFQDSMASRIEEAILNQKLERDSQLLRADRRRNLLKDEPTIDECVTQLVRYIEVRAKDIGERMARSKQLREQA